MEAAPKGNRRFVIDNTGALHIEADIPTKEGYVEENRRVVLAYFEFLQQEYGQQFIDQIEADYGLSFTKMIEEGLVEEARGVYPYRNLNSLNTVGYKELFAYFDGEITLEEAIDLIQRNTRKYARKQLTWFRRDPEIHWFEPQQFSEIIDFVDNKLTIHE